MLNEEPTNKRPYDARDTYHRRFHSFFYQSSLPMELYALDGNIIAANRAWLNLFDTTFEDLEGYNVLQDEQIKRKGLLPFLQRAYKGESVEVPAFCYDPQENGKNGRARWLKTHLFPVKDSSSNETRELAVILLDVTDQITAQAALKQSRDLMQLIADSLPAFVAYLDDKEVYQFANRTYEGWFSPDGKPIKGRTRLDILGPELYQRTLVHINKALSGQRVTTENRVPIPGSNPIDVHASYIPDIGELGQVKGVVLLGYDITQLRSEERSDLSFQKNFLATILNNLAEGIIACNERGELTLFNRATKDFHGFTEAGTPQSEWTETYNLFQNDGKTPLPTDDIPLARALRGEIVKDQEMVIVSQNGKSRSVLSSGQAIYNEEGKKLGAVVAMHDITERKRVEEERAARIREKILHEQAEHARQRSEFLSQATKTLLADPLSFKSRLEKLARSIIPGFADWCMIDVIDSSEIIKPVVLMHEDEAEVNKLYALREAFPVLLHEENGIARVIRTGVSEFIPHVTGSFLETMSHSKEHLEAIRSFKVTSYICVPLRARGHILGALTMASTRERSYGVGDLVLAEELAGRAALAMDNARLYDEARLEIAERTKVEAELRIIQDDLQEAVRSRDEFLSVASHELKTPLTSLKLQLQLAMRRLQNNDPNILQEKSVEKLLTTTSRQVDRLARLVEDMLDISRIVHGKLRFDFEPVDLGALVRDVVDRFNDQLNATSGKPTLEIAEGVVGSWDRYRIEQVFINLLTNSMKYGDAKPISVSVSKENDRAVIRVKDRGVGIAKESLARIFERFERATTGESITGLGLGLYISKQIVAAHHGDILVESELGQGSTFTVVLPMDPDKV